MEYRGYVDHIIYRKEENGYTVFVLSMKDDDITCVGHLPDIDQGEDLLVIGEEVEHTIYGSQVKVTSCRRIMPGDVQGMERYLGSGAIKGVGPALAKRIVRTFGEDTFRIIEEEPERLVEIKGISERIARQISSQMEEKKDVHEAVLFLQQYGISNVLAIRIYETYKSNTYTIIRDNPYRLAEDIHGIGFKMADEIAARLGVRTDSDFRIQSGILYTLLTASREGNVYLPKEMLLSLAASVLNLEPELIEIQLSNLAMEKKVMLKTEGETIAVYAASFYYAEQNCARMLSDIDHSGTVISSGEDCLLVWEYRMHVAEKIAVLEKGMDLELDELQRLAIEESAMHGVFLLTGGPGTGKTTTINALIAYYEREGMDILLAAPTGRAARRMTEATGFEAKTIHRLLELNGSLEEEGKHASFARKEDNPLEADVVIIDEMSMVDLFLFQALLKAVIPGTKLILVGDMNQLPSVGPGQVLRDLIASEVYAAVRLETIFRQATDSDIVVNAHRIHQGKTIHLDNKSKDFFFLERKDVNVIYKHMIQLIRDKLPGYCQISPLEIQVLTPMRKGSLGVEALNRILQEYLNPPDPQKEELEYADTVFRTGDKVMQIKNNYQLEWEIVSKYNIPIDKGIGIFNGDTGVIRQIYPDNQMLSVEFDDGRRVDYTYSLLEELELAYAVTIHKAQGSEYPAVLMPLMQGPRQLYNRNLLYTGVTRAKNCLTILGSREVIEGMIANTSENRRYTGLSLRIREVEGLM